MKLIIVRHGQSTCNAEVRHSGWAQIPLTDNGREDARNAGRLLRGIPFDRVFCSDLLRAQQTMQLAIPADAHRAEIYMELRERSVGELAEQKVSDCLERHGDSYRYALSTDDFSAFGGERREQHLARIRRFLDILEETPCALAVAFSHAGSIECMLELVTGSHKHESGRSCENGSVSVFSFEDGQWRCERWSVTDAAQLDDLRSC